MVKRIEKFGLFFILIAFGLTSCVNLKHVNDFSASSLTSIKKFEEINYSFKQNCLDNCEEKKIRDINLNAQDCNCSLNEKADSVTLVIYSSIRGYFEGLANLSENSATTYKMDALTNALTEGDFGSFKIEKKQVDAYSEISKILLKAFTDNYRRKKIKQYVVKANEPLKVLIDFLDFNLSSNLVGKLNVQKERIKSYYFDLVHDSSLSNLEKRTAVKIYYSELAKIEAKQKELLAYSKAIKKIEEGHQKLADNIENLTKAEVKELITQYVSDIKNIISEFNKAKK